MRKSESHEYRQSYNAQSVVDAEGSPRVLGTLVSRCARDATELVADIEAIPEPLRRSHTVLADNGYADQAEVERLEAKDAEGKRIEVFVSMGAEGRQRRYRTRPIRQTARSTGRQRRDGIKAANREVTRSRASSRGVQALSHSGATVPRIDGIWAAVPALRWRFVRGARSGESSGNCHPREDRQNPAVFQFALPGPPPCLHSRIQGWAPARSAASDPSTGDTALCARQGVPNQRPSESP